MRSGLVVWVVVVAAGRGSRYGRAKQFEILGGRPVLDWSIDAAHSVAEGVVVVLPDPVPGPVPRPGARAQVTVVGGATRAASVRAGLAAVPDRAEVIVVHDAARPLASPALFEAVVDAVASGADGAVPGLALVDTVKRVVDGRVSETVDRRSLMAVQTPQAFRAGPLRAAHRDGAEGTDDSFLVEAGGGTVWVVAGEPGNIKLTLDSDLAVAEVLLGR